MFRNNTDKIEEIFVTLDTHNPEHIAHARFWTNMDGKEPANFQQISYEDILNGFWIPKQASLKEYCKQYLLKLEENGRFKLTIWPEHCLVNSPGREVVDAVKFAIRQWEEQREKRAVYIQKV
jgi:nicotinamidase/pyrazinamidase